MLKFLTEPKLVLRISMSTSLSSCYDVLCIRVRRVYALLYINERHVFWLVKEHDIRRSNLLGPRVSAFAYGSRLINAVTVCVSTHSTFVVTSDYNFVSSIFFKLIQFLLKHDMGLRLCGVYREQLGRCM